MMRKRGGFLGGRLLTMALACVLASSTCVAVAMGADTAPSTEPAKIATGGALSSTPDDQSADDADAGISAQAVDITSQEQLEPYIVPGLDPDNTTVNLFNYDTGRRSGQILKDQNGNTVVTDGNPQGTIGGASTAGTDTLGSTGAATPYINYLTWLTGENNINRGRLLTFGDGTRHLGYWNQGLVKQYDNIALQYPGMQGIVQATLRNGFPAIDLNNYDKNPEVYKTAHRDTKWSKNEMIYGNAGPLYQASLANT